MLGGVLSTACAAPPMAATEGLWQRVLDEVGPARCQSDAVCRSIGVGHKPCGGPAGYLAWSTESSRESELRARVAAHAQAEADAQARDGRVSNCMVTPDPGARCDLATQRCVLRAMGGGALVR